MACGCSSGQFDKADKIITDNRVLFHRVANTLNYLDIKTVVVSCGTCYDQLQGYEFDKIFPGNRIIDIHEYLLEKGVTLRPETGQGTGYLFHDSCHSPMKLQEPMKTVKALLGDNVLKNERCCGESGTLGVTRPDISTQVRFRKEEELQKGEASLRASGAVSEKQNVKILTSCPNCLQGLARYQDDMKNGLLVFKNNQLRVIQAVEAGFPAFYRVVWNAHVAEFSDLSIDERNACMNGVVSVEQVLREQLQPTKINLAALGNMVPHLHWHVVDWFDWDSHFPATACSTAQRAEITEKLAQTLEKCASVNRSIAQALAP
jgi:diadenosine tetraphosphate (Ap4A) HIT family hydrolase